jgi:hypothetical protein
MDEVRKTGVNMNDRNRIRELAEDKGLDAETIGQMLLIDVEAVKSFMPKKGRKKTPKKTEDDPDFLK